MTDDRLTRRRFLVGTSAAVAVGLAGCGGSAESGQNDASGGQNATTTDESTKATTSESTKGSHAAGHAASHLSPSGSATVQMKTTSSGSHFEPHVVWVERGGTVTWTLASGSHSTTAYAKENGKPQRIPDGASAWDSGVLSEQGASFEHTFETVGVYDYFCIPHEAAGMLGSVIVGHPDAADQPALEPPEKRLPAKAERKIKSLNAAVTDALNGTTENGTDSGHHSERAQVRR